MEFLSSLTIFGATEQPSGIAALGIDPLAILAQALTFLVLFFIIKKFALDKIVSTLEKRRKTIDDGVRLGLEMEAEKTKLDEKVEHILRKARGEADQIIAQAHEESGAIVKEAEVKATQKVDTMLADAHHKISDEITKAKKDLERETVELVALATEKIIKQKVDSTKDADLIKRSLQEAAHE
jgi:F-type H+-transporting ATPase subunit b